MIPIFSIRTVIDCLPFINTNAIVVRPYDSSNNEFAHLCRLACVHASQKKYSAHDKMDKHIASFQIVR